MTTYVDFITADPGESVNINLIGLAPELTPTEVISSVSGDDSIAYVITNAAGTSVGSGTLSASADTAGDWIVEVLAPSTEGKYKIAITATIGSTVGKFKGWLLVDSQ